MIGHIHSTESFGTVECPGVRFVIFFQGCPMRCKYCHNPDTWTAGEGKEYTAEALLEAYERNRVFYRGGGITATGGEPLMQLPFLTELCEKAHERGIHTCLDTSGIVYRESRREEFERLFSVTDLVLLDIKHSDADGHRELTGQPQEPVLAFAEALNRAGVPMVIRHVVVPGITDDEAEWKALGRLIGPFANLKGLEVLPYHTMGKIKYENLGIPYLLEGVLDLDKEVAQRARSVILQEIRKVRG